MDKWSKEDRSDLRKFIESETGKKFMKRLEETIKQLSNASMGSKTQEEAFRYSMIGNGFLSVKEDIEMLTKEEDTAKNKK